MDEAALDRIRVLIAQFHHDREMEGYSATSRRQTGWALWYLLDFLKGRDEAEVTAITAETLHKFQMDLYNRRGKEKEALGMVSQGHVLVAARVFFQWLVRRGHILADPSAGIQLPRQKQPLPKGVMTLREVERLLASPDVETHIGLRNRAMLELLYSSGLRNTEMRNLKLYDVNVAEEEVLVRDGKGGKDRLVPLGKVAGKYVELYVKESRPKLLREREDPGYLFLGRFGGRMAPTSVNENVVQVCIRRAGIKKHVTPHGLRHTCATHLLKGRANIRHIQALLGHKSLDTTQLYTRVDAGDLKRELRRCHPRERVK